MNEIDIEQALGEIIYYTRFFRSFGSVVPTFHAELLTYFHSFSPVSTMPITGRCLEEGIEQSGIRVLVCFPHFLIARITLNQSLKIG